MTSPSRPSLLHAGAPTFAASLLSLGAGLATTVLVARALGPGGKGEYDLAMTTAALGQMALGLSLPVGVTYVIARNAAASGVLVRRLAGWAPVQGAIMAGALFAWFNRPGRPEDTGAVDVAVIAALSMLVAVSSVAGYLRAVLLGRQRIIEVNRADVLGRVAIPAIMVGLLGAWLALGEDPAAVLFVWAAVAASGVATVYLWTLVRGELAASAAGPSAMPTVLRFSLATHMSNVVQFLNYRLDVFIVTALLGTAALGLYALAVSVAQLLWLISVAASVVLFPRVASNTETSADTAARTAQVARVVLTISVLGAGGLALGGPLLVRTLYGNEFAGAISPLLLLLPGIAVFSLPNVLASYIAGVGRPRLNLYVALAALAVTIALDLALIPAMGIDGAAIASTASYAVSAVLTIGLFVAMTGVSVRDVVLPHRADAALLNRVARALRRRLSAGTD